MNWKCRDQAFCLDDRSVIMGILNVTPDSFSDGGNYDTVESAVAQALDMWRDGARIIDIGGESTRPGADEVAVDDEKNRVLPVIEKLVSLQPDICISVDTSKAEVAEAAMKTGASIINDVTGFRDPEMIRVAQETKAGLVAMHMKGTPRTMQKAPEYADVAAEVRDFFSQQHQRLLDAGIAADSMVYDPGIGFGKTLDHNLALLKSLDQLSVEERPLLLGVSRKSFMGAILESEDLHDREAPTVGITSWARSKGVRIHRVHEVKANAAALRVIDAIHRRDPNI